MSKNREKIITENDEDSFPSLFPTSMKIASQTISSNLVSVQPIDGIIDEKLNEIKQKIQIENRENLIDSIENDAEYVEKIIEDDEEYKNLIKIPEVKLMYIDYTYGTTNKKSIIKKNK